MTGSAAQVAPEALPAELGELADVAGPIVREVVRLPWSGTTLRLTRPAAIDSLLDRAAADPEQHLPYWAELWPSGLALADAICRDRPPWEGVPVLEVGCGLGATAIAAVGAGADLIATDYAPEALALCRVNCRDNGASVPRTARLNWRALEASTVPALGGPFPVVVAADVLYERRDVEPLLAFFDVAVAPGGLLWLGEPGRPPAADWLAAASDAGWTVESEHHGGPWPDPEEVDVVVRLHKLRRPS